jgi:hypothetical protein
MIEAEAIQISDTNTKGVSEGTFGIVSGLQGNRSGYRT